MPNFETESPRRLVRAAAVEWAPTEREARKRVGKSDLSRLKWLLGFASAPAPARMDRAALVQRRAEVSLFSLRTGHAQNGAMTLHDPAGRVTTVDYDLSARELAVLAREAEHTIAELLGGGHVVFEVGKAGRVWRAITQSFTSSWGGDSREIFRMAMIDVLAAEGRRLARCSWKPCNKPFVRRKRGAYCSRACSQRARQARFRERHGEEEQRKRRHASYVRWVRKTKGAAIAAKVRERTKQSNGG